MGALTDARPLLDWSVAARILAGEAESGDGHLVAPFLGGALVAVIDGLGHGSEAAAAARAAIGALEAHPAESVVSLLQSCHQALRGTRGAVMTLASFSASSATMTWLGVGNVEGVLLRASANGVSARESVLLRGGVVGYEIPPLRAVTHPVAAGDTLILATDGIRGGFGEGLGLDASPREMADRILAQHAKGTDDALVLVARCLAMHA